MKRNLIILAVFCAILAAVTVVGRQAVLKSVAVTPPAASITPQVAKAITNPLEPDKVPVEGRDFIIQDKRFFEDRQWLVATVAPADIDKTDPALIIMKQADGTYVRVLGPGTMFPANGLAGVPESVVTYLKQINRVYQPVD